MSETPLQVPVAFFIFNRPDTTAMVFAEIAKVRPTKLLVVGDGARLTREGEQDKVTAARKIIESVDWPCEVVTNYSDVNLGCKHRLASGIDWVFKNVEKAIILEDDCLPNRSFFLFCDKLLKENISDKNIFAISGTQFIDSQDGDGDDFYYSKYALMWGWATWRDRWQKYRCDITLLEILDGLFLRNKNLSLKAKIYWAVMIYKATHNRINTWDYQWIFTVLVNNGLVCRPYKNLIKNIGFGVEATHTFDANSKMAELEVTDFIESVIKGPSMKRNNAAQSAVDERVWLDLSYKRIVVQVLGLLK